MTALPSAPWQAAQTAAKLAAPLTRSGFATWAGAAATAADAAGAAPAAGATSPAANDDTAGTASKAASRGIANSFISGVLIGLAHKTYNLRILQWLGGHPDDPRLAAVARHRPPPPRWPTRFRLLPPRATTNFPGARHRLPGTAQP